MKLGVIWFGNDLRCADQYILWQAAQAVDYLVCLYCDEPHHKRPSRYATQGMSANRRKFLEDGLHGLAQQLKTIGQTLYVSQNDAVTSLTLLLNTLPISHIYRNHHSGWDEQQTLKQLTERFADVHVHIDHNVSLFEPSQLPFSISKLPDSFSKFYRLVESIEVDTPLPSLRTLPPVPNFDILTIRPWQSKKIEENRAFTGGQRAASHQLSDYFSTCLPSFPLG